MNAVSDTLSSGRDVRQRDLVPPQALAGCHALVIGVGAIGRQVALQLAAVGMPSMHLFDDDTVQVKNLASQGYWPEDLNAAKATVTAALCRRTNPDIEVVAIAERFKRSTPRTLPAGRQLVAFLCVDSIQARRLIWEALSPHVAFFVDGRMSAEVIRVLTADSPAMDRHYTTTLFQPEQAYAGSCTAKSTIYTASIAAGLMLAQFTRWLRRLPVDADLTLNLLASEMTVGTSG